MQEMPHCNAGGFLAFLDECSLTNPDEFKVMVLDKGAFHKAKSLIIQVHIAWLFLHPYSPEQNPEEKIWVKLKRTFTNRLFNSLELLMDFIGEVTNIIEKTIVKSTCAFTYIFIKSFWIIL